MRNYEKNSKADIQQFIESIPTGKALIKERAELKKQTNRNKRRLKSLNATYEFIPSILYPDNNIEHEKSICLLLKRLGFNAHWTGSNTNKCDIIVTEDDWQCIIECRSIKKHITLRDDELTQLLKRRIEYSNNSVNTSFLAIVNFDKETPVKERSNEMHSHPTNTKNIELFTNSYFSLISTISLFNLFEQHERGIITTQDIKKRLQQHGVITA